MQSMNMNTNKKYYSNPPLLQGLVFPILQYSVTPSLHLFCLLALITLIYHGSVEAADSSSRHIQYSFTLQNTKNTVIPTAEFWTYAPVKKTANQKFVGLKTGYSYKTTSDDLGNQVLQFTFNEIPPFGTKIINIRAELEVFQKPKPMAVKNLQPFLAPEKYIESNAPEIINLAKKLKVPDDLKTAKKIFSWVSRTLTYIGYVKNDRGALWALKQKKGDCTEFMYLFVALCRASGIPARGVGGYVINKNSTLRPADYHNWAEFYVTGLWRVADPQKKVFMKNESHYIAIRIINRQSENSMGDFHRFRFAGEGLTVKMKQ